MTESKDKVTIGLRLASMLVDHFIMTLIMMIIALPGFIISFIRVFSMDQDHQPTNFNMGSMFFLFALGFSAYFNKDIFNGRSPAKRILKLQVIDNKTNQVAAPIKCLVRNLTIIFWPIEVIFILINPKRRLGDKIAGTRIDYVEHPEQVATEWKKIIAPLMLAIGFSVLISLPFVVMRAALSHNVVEFIKASFNQQASEEENHIFESQLNGLIKKADFEIYDKVANDNRKYVSGILYFSNRNDYNNFDSSEKYIIDLLNSKYPRDSNIYFLKFVYRVPGSISTREKLYDAEIDKRID